MTNPPPKNPIRPVEHLGKNMRQPVPSESSVHGPVYPEHDVVQEHLLGPGPVLHEQSTQLLVHSPLPPPPPVEIISAMILTSLGKGTGHVQ